MTMRRTITIAIFVLAGTVFGGGCNGGGGPSTSPGHFDPEPPGINPNPKNTWLRCVCSGCTGPGGSAVSTEPVAGCTTDTCESNAATLTADCAQFCANWGLTACASTAPAAMGCFDAACEECTGATCSQGACFTAGDVCGRQCNTPSDCGCEMCVSQAGGPGICVQPHAGALCGQTGTPPISLDRSWGRVSIALDTSGTFGFDSSDANGSTNIADGSALIVARNCPGAGCAMRMNDLFVQPHDFSANVKNTLAHIFGHGSVSINGAILELVRPSTFDAHADATFRIPQRGVETLLEFSADGQFNNGNALNDGDVTGGIDFATGAFSLAAGFAAGGANVTFNLIGHVTNFPPHASAGSDQPAVQCQSTSGAVVHLDGSGSTDLPPGPGIVSYLWFENFDRVTGTGVLLASGVQPSVTLPLGTHHLTLIAIDGEGALDLSDVTVTIIDTLPPVVTESIPDDCLWPPNHKWVHYDLFTDILATAHNTCFGDLTSQLRILDVTSNQPPQGGGSGNTAPDVTWDAAALCVRSERDGTLKTDRVYTVTIGVTDGSGNLGTATATIVVPHNPAGGPNVCKQSPSTFVDDGDPRCQLAFPTLPLVSRTPPLAVPAETRPSAPTAAAPEQTPPPAPAAATPGQTPPLTTVTTRSARGGCSFGGDSTAPFGTLALLALTLVALRGRTRRGRP
jgi:hypothetical protein